MNQPTTPTTPDDSVQLTLEAAADHLIRLCAMYFASAAAQCPRDLRVLADAAMIGGSLPQVMIELGEHGATIVTAIGRSDGKAATGPEPETVMLTSQFRALNPPPGSVSTQRVQ